MGFKLGGCIERWEVEKKEEGREGRKRKGGEGERRGKVKGERGRKSGREGDYSEVQYYCTTCRVSSIPYSHESSCTRLGRSILRVHQF